MIRTHVSPEEAEYKLAKKEARTLGISVAEFVRRAIRQTLPPAAGAPWMRYAGFVESGDKRPPVRGRYSLWRERLNRMSTLPR